MNKLKVLAILMIITILVITGFQVFWLKQNFDREKKALDFRTGISFREAIFGLQADKFKMGHFPADTGTKFTIEVHGVEPHDFDVPAPPGDKIVSMVNVLREKVKDSAVRPKGQKPNMFFEVDKSLKNDNISLREESEGLVAWQQDGKKMVKILYGIDSAMDSLKVKEITEATSKALKSEKLDVGFNVSRLDTVMEEKSQTENIVTIGFAHPVSYQIKLENTLPYLLKKLTSPLLFSFLLIGFTIFSFVLLYRSLLQQKRLAELKNDFISNITHELNTPIATVSVAIEALRSFGVINNPEKTKEYLDISASELSRLSLLVNKVLKLSMFEKNEVKLNKEMFNLKQLVEEVIAIMKLQFEKYDAKVSMKSEGDDFMIDADRLHLTSVVYNLLDNALKYSKEKPVIQVQVRSLPSHVELEVKDNGTGIPAEYTKKVFEKFFRVPHGDVHNTKGYGLGLSYVNNIVRRHHGIIDVISELGKGSTFTVNIPYREAPGIKFDEHRKVVKEKDFI